jgi:hypothetical protein
MIQNLKYKKFVHLNGHAFEFQKSTTVTTGSPDAPPNSNVGLTLPLAHFLNYWSIYLDSDLGLTIYVGAAVGSRH